MINAIREQDIQKVQLLAMEMLGRKNFSELQTLGYLGTCKHEIKRLDKDKREPIVRALMCKLEPHYCDKRVYESIEKVCWDLSGDIIEERLADMRSNQNKEMTNEDTKSEYEYARNLLQMKHDSALEKERVNCIWHILHRYFLSDLSDDKKAVVTSRRLITQ